MILIIKAIQFYYLHLKSCQMEIIASSDICILSTADMLTHVDVEIHWLHTAFVMIIIIVGIVYKMRCLGTAWKWTVA